MTIDRPAPGQVPELRQLWKEAFGDSDAFLDAFFTTAFSPNRCRCVTVQNRLAAALYWFDVSCDGEKMAYLYAVATAEAFRGRGLCRALLEDTHGCLTRQGYTGALLMPQEAGLREMYRKFGYRDGCAIREFVCTPEPYPVSIHTIDREEFARLRRKYLPKGGVLQEAENLAFLETQAKFYAGVDFVLAARQDGSSLEGLELLGNSAAAPGILTALGCARGSFRAPGEGRPFAMFLPLAPGVRAPAYFGLVFD